MQTFPEGAFSSNANYYLGSIAFSKKEYDEALQRFKSVIESGDTKFLEESVARTAEMQYLTQDFPAALESFKRLQIIAENPENKQAARLGIMRCALQTGQQEEAQLAANELLKDPKLYAKLKKAPAAELSLSTLISLFEPTGRILRSCKARSNCICTS